MHPSRWLRMSPAVIFASLAVVILGSLLGRTSTAAAAGRTPVTMADAFLVEHTGEWFCPGRTVSCSERGSQGFVSGLLKSGNLDRQGPPLYLRVAKSRNDCNEGERCAEIGVPSATPCPTAEATPFCALMALKDKGVRLGIVLGAAKDGDDHLPRAASAIAWQACQIRIADDRRLYDFMFLDLTFKLEDRPLRTAVRLIQGGKIIRDGRRVACPAGGWPRLITNDTTWQPGRKDSVRRLNTGAWAHAKRLGVIEQAGHPTSASNALAPIDRAFVRTVNQLRSRAVLRLEVTPDTSEFSQLGLQLQCSLLARWARQQSPRRFTFLFPLYVHGAGVQGPDDNPYDSLDEGTFARQFELIANPSKPPTRCRAPQAGQPGAVAPPPVSNPGVAPTPPASAAARPPDVMSHEPSNIGCRRARFNGWVNPHGVRTAFHFEYWKRGEPSAAQRTGDGDAGAGLDRVEVARVAEGLAPNTGYTGRLIASSTAGRVVSAIFSFTTPRC